MSVDKSFVILFINLFAFSLPFSPAEPDHEATKDDETEPKQIPLWEVRLKTVLIY